jgi:hypothetical protein
LAFLSNFFIGEFFFNLEYLEKEEDDGKDILDSSLLASSLLSRLYRRLNDDDEAGEANFDEDLDRFRLTPDCWLMWSSLLSSSMMSLIRLFMLLGVLGGLPLMPSSVSDDKMISS